MVEGRPELLHLLLADALGVAGEDLVLDLVDGAGDGGEQLLPAHPDVLGRNQGVSAGWASGQGYWDNSSCSSGGSDLGSRVGAICGLESGSP